MGQIGSKFSSARSFCLLHTWRVPSHGWGARAQFHLQEWGSRCVDRHTLQVVAKEVTNSTLNSDNFFSGFDSLKWIWASNWKCVIVAFFFLCVLLRNALECLTGTYNDSALFWWQQTKGERQSQSVAEKAAHQNSWKKMKVKITVLILIVSYQPHEYLCISKKWDQNLILEQWSAVGYGFIENAVARVQEE